MLFSSPIFIFQFLPLALLLYFLQPKLTRNVFLLIISLIFYAWGEPVFVLLMILSIIVNFFIGMLIDRAGRPAYRTGRRKKWALTLGVIFNIGLLVYYKYSWFITQNLNAAFGWNIGESVAIAMPIGISFYTFQSLSYLIDVYRNEVKAQTNIVSLGLFISFFPQLIAGPIIRYKDVNEQIAQRQMTWTLFGEGVQRFIIGLAKKVLLANTLGEVADRIFDLPPGQITFLTSWLGITCYSFQIYFDFSGYSDMAIGLGKMFGFNFMENFNYPYAAKGIRDFWRRWHISLSTWFRDYLYVPLGGNRGSAGRTYFNLVIVFFVTGLWHGASWNFVVWGLFHGFFLILERSWLGKKLDSLWSPLQHLYTLLVVVIGWVFFRSLTLEDAFDYLNVMAGMSAYTKYPLDFLEFVDPKIWSCLVLAALFSMPLLKGTLQSNGRLAMAGRMLTTILLISIFILSVASIAADSYNPFIYFRF